MTSMAGWVHLSDLPCPPRFGTQRSPDRLTLGPRAYEISQRLGRPYMPHQRYIADVALEIDPDTGRLAYSEIIVVGPRQLTGKALDVATPLWTQRGWVPMGDVRVGDQVVHPGGHFTDVVFTSEVMHGHACYEVVTSDGRSVVADADHLWSVRDTYSGGVRPWRVMTTAEILKSGLRNRGPRGAGGGYRFRLPVQAGVKTPDVELPLDPYLFGVWLGDGSSYKAEVTSADPEVFAAFTAGGFTPSYSYPTGRAVTRGLLGLVKILRRMGVLGGKWVPDVYLTAGYDQRLALLQGMMDSDGCITENHGSSPRCEFTSTRRPLADAVLFLARSLGWRASLIEGRAMLNGRDCGTKWRVAFTATTDDPCPFRLPRKVGMIRASMPRTGVRTAVSIVAVRPIASRPVRCIKVDSSDGLFLAGRDLVSCHNTELILPIMTHRCLGFGQAGPQRVMYTAQTADAGKEKWRDVHLPRLKASPTIARRFRERKTANQEAFLWDNGSIWSPGSTTGKASGTGDTLDMAVIDESWSRPDARTELGMRPAMLTRPWKQLWEMSMIPGLSRAQPGDWPYLAHKQQIGRARVDADVRRGVAYFEFSAPEGLDPGNPATWWSCMPGLGLFPGAEQAVADDFDALDLVDFCAEYLGWAPQSGPTARWTLIPKALWEGLCDPLSQIDGHPALGVEISEDRTRAFIGAAGRRFDFHHHVELIEPGQQIGPVTAGIEWLEPRLFDIIEAWKPSTVVIDPRRPANSLVPVLRRRGIDVTTPAMGAIAGACGRFVDLTGAGENTTAERVFHLGQPEVEDALAHARKLEFSEGQFTIVRKGHSADLGALYTLILALYGDELKGHETLPEPEIFA